MRTWALRVRELRGWPLAAEVAGVLTAAALVARAALVVAGASMTSPFGTSALALILISGGFAWYARYRSKRGEHPIDWPGDDQPGDDRARDDQLGGDVAAARRTKSDFDSAL